MLLAKANLNTIKGLIFKALIDSYNDPDEFVSVNNLSQEYNEIREKIKYPENPVEYTL